MKYLFLLFAICTAAGASAQTYERGYDPRKVAFSCATDEVQFPGNEALNEAIITNNGEYRFEIRQISEGPFADIKVRESRTGEFEVLVFEKDSGDLVFRQPADGQRRISTSDFSGRAELGAFEITLAIKSDGVSILGADITLGSLSTLQASCEDIIFFE